MATENVPVYNQYVGNGLATRFSIGFPYLDRDYVKVYIKRVGGVEEELTDDRYEFENDTTIVFPLNDDDDLLQDGDILTIQRETELGSDFEFDNQRRLFPEEVMNADDLSFQQIQELKRELDRAVKSRATDTITGPELYESLQQQYKDVEIKAGLAASSANMAQTWAEGTDSAVAELGGEHSSKEWANHAETLVGPLAPIAPQLAELANHVEELDTVAGSIDSVNIVADRVAPNAQKIADANDNFEQLLKQINGEGDLDSIVSGNNVTQATSSVRGTARFATDAEAQAGTSTSVMITPKQLKQYSGGGGGSVDAYTKAQIDEMFNNVGDSIEDLEETKANAIDVTDLSSHLDAVETEVASKADTSLSNLDSEGQAKFDAKADTASPAFTGTPTAPTPTATDNSTRIATTAFVKSVLSGSGRGLATISKEQNGYCKFTNGLIIQWGFSASFGTDTVITFPTPFSSGTSFTVIATPRSSAAYEYPTYIKTQTATNFTGRRNDTNKPITQWLAIGY